LDEILTQDRDDSASGKVDPAKQPSAAASASARTAERDAVDALRAASHGAFRKASKAAVSSR
jgi:hypothetical protein